MFCLLLVAPSATHVATGLTEEVGTVTPPLNAVLVTNGKIIPTASIFSIIFCNTLSGITAPTSVVTVVVFLNSSGIATPFVT